MACSDLLLVVGPLRSGCPGMAADGAGARLATRSSSPRSRATGAQAEQATRSRVGSCAEWILTCHTPFSGGAPLAQSVAARWCPNYCRDGARFHVLGHDNDVPTSEADDDAGRRRLNLSGIVLLYGPLPRQERP